MKSILYQWLILSQILVLPSSVISQTLETRKIEAKKQYETGWYLFNQEKYEEALPYLNSAISFDSKNYLYLYAKGRTLARLEKYSEAIQYYTACIGLNIKYADAYARRAGCTLLKGNSSTQELEIIKSDCDKAIQLDKTSFVAYHNRGKYFLYILNYSMAINDFTEAIKVDPSDYHSYVYRAESYVGIKNYRSAILDCDRAITIKPDWSGAFHQRAVANLGLNNYQATILDCTKSINFGYNKYESYLVRAYAYFCTGNFEDSVNDCDVVLERFPSDNNTLKIRSAAQSELEKIRQKKAAERQKQLEEFTPGQRLLIGFLELAAKGSNSSSDNQYNNSSRSGKRECQCRVCGGDGVIEGGGTETVWETSCSCYVGRRRPDQYCSNCDRGKVWCN